MTKEQHFSLNFYTTRLKSSFVAEPRPASMSFPDEVNELVKSR